MRRVAVLLAVALTVGFAASANADLIAYWNCDNETNLGGTTGLWRLNPLGAPGAETDYPKDMGNATAAEISTWGTDDPSEGNLVGTNGTSGSSAADNFGSFTGTSLNALDSNSPNGSLSVVGMANNEHYFLIKLDDKITDATLTYATRGTSTGYTTHTYYYSINGGASWTFLTSHAANMTSTWATHNVALDGIFANTWGAEINQIKVVVSGATGTTGNNRFDNFQINGTNLYPEPATLMLLGIGGLLVIRRR